MKIKNLAEDIINFNRTGGDILIQGDINARTSNTNDTVEPDKYDVGNEKEQLKIPLRNSADKIKDGRGRELIELCKSLDLCILNGRKTGDQFGSFKSFQWKGSGVVDYAISSQSLFSKISSFSVGDCKPWISDHCAIHHSIQVQNVNSNVLIRTDLNFILGHF